MGAVVREEIAKVAAEVQAAAAANKAADKQKKLEEQAAAAEMATKDKKENAAMDAAVAKRSTIMTAAAEAVRLGKESGRRPAEAVKAQTVGFFACCTMPVVGQDVEG